MAELTLPYTRPSDEHGFVWHKSTDKEFRRSVLMPNITPGKAKRLGRSVELRPGWGSMKLPVMRLLVLEKFTQNPSLGRRLLATGSARLVEGNHWGDSFWGRCEGVGENHLGRILMQVRRTLQIMEANNA